MAITTANTLVLCGQGGSTIFQWINGATVTSSDTTAAMTGISILSQATLMLKVQSVSGTSPTLNCYVQKQLPDGVTYQDIASFTQVTTTATRVMHMVTGGNKEEAQAINTLAAGTVNAVPFGSIWRLSFVVAGTSPSFNVSFWMEGLT